MQGRNDLETREFVQKDLFLNEGDQEEEYRRRKDEEKTSICWGQRKLLLTLVQFLTYFLDFEEYKNPIVLYVGAAPGFNIEIVTVLFPEIEWHLYDPANFKVKADKNIHIYQEYFTDKTANYWRDQRRKGKNVYFISDIRTANYLKAKNLDENEKEIMQDMERQRKWVEIIQPLYSHLKFRPPYTGGNRPEEIEYFKGMIFKQCFSPQTSTETRLVPILEDDKFQMKQWNCRKYQSQLFYHNVIIRENFKYTNPFSNDNSFIDAPELLNDWDSRCEVQIWSEYLSFRNAEVNKTNVVALSRLATAKLNRGRKYQDTLAYLRSHPRAIKERNFQKSRDDRPIIDRKKIHQEIGKWSKWIQEKIL